MKTIFGNYKTNIIIMKKTLKLINDTEGICTKKLSPLLY